MIFWDPSAIIPLCLEEPLSREMRAIHQDDPDMAAWWGSVVECRSAFARLERDGARVDAADCVAALRELERAWVEILPSDREKDTALRLLAVHTLRAADALQLAAAVLWAGPSTSDRSIACLDVRLRTAAAREGFALLPARYTGR